MRWYFTENPTEIDVGTILVNPSYKSCERYSQTSLLESRVNLVKLFDHDDNAMPAPRPHKSCLRTMNLAQRPHRMYWYHHSDSGITDIEARVWMYEGARSRHHQFTSPFSTFISPFSTRSMMLQKIVGFMDYHTHVGRRLSLSLACAVRVSTNIQTTISLLMTYRRINKLPKDFNDSFIALTHYWEQEAR